MRCLSFGSNKRDIDKGTYSIFCSVLYNPSLFCVLVLYTACFGFVASALGEIRVDLMKQVLELVSKERDEGSSSTSGLGKAALSATQTLWDLCLPRRAEVINILTFLSQVRAEFIANRARAMPAARDADWGPITLLFRDNTIMRYFVVFFVGCNIVDKVQQLQCYVRVG